MGMRILTVHGPATGGMHRVVVWLNGIRHRRGWTTRIITTSAGFAGSCGDLARLYQNIIQFNPQLIEAHGWRSGFTALWVIRRARLNIPLVNIIHTFPPAGLATWAWQRLAQCSWLQPSLYIAVSPALRSWLTSRFRVPVALIPLLPPSPVVPRRQARNHLGIPPTHLLVGSIGRLTRAKGYDVLLRAWARLRSYHAAAEPWRLFIIGDGPDKLSLHRLAQRLGVADSVYWAGELPDAGRWVSAFDLYVQPSRSEAAGLAAVEAGRAGVPVIAAATGGLVDLVGPAALLFQPGNPEQLAAALRQAISWTPLERTEQGKLLQQSLHRRFAATSIGDPTSFIYQRLVAATAHDRLGAAR